jgi:hypothetical protein
LYKQISRLIGYCFIIIFAIFFEKSHSIIAFFVFIGLAIGFILLIPITITISHHIYRKYHPYLGPPQNEIQRLKVFLEKVEITQFIQYMFSRKKASVHIICRRIERMYGVRLRHKKGPQWGHVIAEIEEKICEIVGVKNEEEYRMRRREI